MKKQEGHIPGLALYSGLVMPYSVGLQDSLNPFALSSFLLFVIFLFFINSSGRNVIFAGVSYALGLFAGTLWFALGLMDGILEHNLYYVIVNHVFLVLGAVFIVIGALNFMDWIKLRRIRGFEPLSPGAGKFFTIRFPILEPPAVNADIDVEKAKRGWGRRLVSFLLWVSAGFCVSLLSGVWPQDYLLFLHVAHFLQQGQWLEFMIVMVKYCIGYITPILIFLIILWVLKKSRASAREKLLPLAKILLAALFLGVGISLIRIYFLHII